MDNTLIISYKDFLTKKLLNWNILEYEYNQSPYKGRYLYLFQKVGLNEFKNILDKIKIYDINILSFNNFYLPKEQIKDSKEFTDYKRYLFQYWLDLYIQQERDLIKILRLDWINNFINSIQLIDNNFSSFLKEKQIDIQTNIINIYLTRYHEIKNILVVLDLLNHISVDSSIIEKIVNILNENLSRKLNTQNLNRLIAIRKNLLRLKSLGKNFLQLKLLEKNIESTLDRCNSILLLKQLIRKEDL